jgi:hypothetical protein
VEQRTDETARPGVSAEDTGPPPAADGQTDTGPAAGDSNGDGDNHARETESAWSPAASSGGAFGRSARGAPGDAYQAPSADAPSSSTTSGSTYPADDTFTGKAADSGFTAPAAERDYPAPTAPSRDFPSPAATGHDYGASPAESIYSNSGTQRDFSPPPYPAQVTPTPRSSSDARPEQPETATPDRPGRQSPWQAAAARMPRPQSVPRRPKAQRAQKDGAPARQAHLMVSRFEPWSVMKFSFMISLACFVILFVAVTLLYGTLAGLGVFDSIQKALSNVTSGQGTNGVSISHWFSASTILGYTALLGVLNVFLITAFSTVGSVVYNLTAHLVGGVEVTLRETE